MRRVIGVTIDGAFSGADNAFFEGLRSRGYLKAVISADLPAIWKALYLAGSFRLPKNRWYSAWQHRMVKSPGAFVRRTREVSRKLSNRESEFDAILQIGGLFAPYEREFRHPVTCFCDYTTKLAERNFERWFGLNKRDADHWYKLETDLYRKCHLICTASENTRQSIVQDYGIHEHRVKVIGEGVDRIYHHPDKTFREQIILMVGIDFDRKGGHTLVEAFRRVKRALPHSKLYIVGPSNGILSDGIFWLGHIGDRGRLQELFAEASVFAMPSICEPFGLALIEAMSHGLPVIGSTVDAMSEIIEEGKTGYLVAPRDVEALAEKLIYLLSYPEISAQMGRNGRERVTQRFLWQHAIERLESALFQ